MQNLSYSIHFRSALRPFWHLTLFRSRRICAHQLFDRMASSRKNKKRRMTPAASGECRINALPNRLLHRMLSFLPAHEAVRTSFLSHRWRHVWQSMRVLRVSAYELRHLWGPARFNEFVNHLLFLRDQVPLDGFTITPYPIWVALGQPMGDTVEKVRYVQTWIQYALMRDVRVLRVRNMPFTKYLRLVKLPLTSSHLRTLELQTVELDVRPLDFTSCPVLEKLRVRNCRISSLKLSSQSLRHLCMTWCIFSPDICTLISAPNLLSLQLDVENGRLPFIGSMPLLETARVEFSGSFTDRCGHSVGDCSRDACASCYGDRYGSCKRLLLGSLSNATHLELVDGSKTVCLHFYLISQ